MSMHSLPSSLLGKLSLQWHPGLRNLLHLIGAAGAHSLTSPDELDCLRRHAAGRSLALEIGTHMGVSAVAIAGALSPEGRLLCVDPWHAPTGKTNSCFAICRRELRRRGLAPRVTFLQGTSQEVEDRIPAGLDFVFVDGDHSYAGLRTDWRIVEHRLAVGGIVCLHDTSVPEAQPERRYGAAEFYESVIRRSVAFEWVERCHSMNVLRRVA